MTPTSVYSSLAARTTTDPCAPCPECGGLECLCRPRFFAGQLLTEADLNRLDHYILAKNRLHNRHLHGWGVSCGLEVVCHPCGNQVIVRAGYALSPCGDDIILCSDVPVDICQLITGCCEPEPDDCFPQRPRPAECEEVEQQWILAVCYDEHPSRNAPTLKATNGCTPKCSCGGTQGSCGCNGSSKQSSPATRSLRPPPVQCEPTMICESYRFVAYPAPPEDPERQDRGAMFERFLACLSKLTSAIPQPPSQNNLTLAAVQAWCAQVRRVLIDTLRNSPGTNCALLDLLNAPCPPVSPNMTPQQYLQLVVQQFLPVLTEYLRGCLCSALLPPCPEPALSNCVPLATLTIQRKGCRLLRVCNLEGRKFLTTFPNLQYWLSWLPYVRNLRAALARICCRVLDQQPVPGVTVGAKPTFNSANLNASASRQTSNISSVAASAFARRASAGPKGVEAVAYASVGLNDEKGTPFLKDADLTNPLAVAMADDLLAPILGDVFPAEAIAAFASAGGDAAADNVKRERAQDQQIQDLNSQIEQLQQTVTKQQMTIDGLVRAMRPTPPTKEQNPR